MNNLWARAMDFIDEHGKAEISKQMLQRQGVPKSKARDIVIKEMPEERKPIEEESDQAEQVQGDDEDEIEWI